MLPPAITTLILTFGLTAASVSPPSHDEEFTFIAAPEKVVTSKGGLYIKGGRKFRKQVLENLQTLTDYPLDFLFGTGQVVLTGNPSTHTKPGGNALLLQLIQSSLDIDIIRSKDGLNHFYPNSHTKLFQQIPIGGTIHFDPGNKKGGDTHGDGNKRPACIGLAHELIHALHAINGLADVSDITCSDELDEGSDTLTQEELLTRLKENVIRKEQNLPPRVTPESCTPTDSLTADDIASG